MPPPLLIVLVGLLYVLGFSVLSFMRRQGISTRFFIEGLGISAAFAVLSFAVPVNFVIFLIILYLITMRVRLLVDFGSWITSRKRFTQALRTYDLALRLGPDDVGRQLVLINRGVTLLRMGDPEAAYGVLKEAVSREVLRMGAKFHAAGFYNLGLACRRTNREAEAIRYFNDAINALPSSIYAHGARQALKQGKADKK